MKFSDLFKSNKKTDKQNSGMNQEMTSVTNSATSNSVESSNTATYNSSFSSTDGSKASTGEKKVRVFNLIILDESGSMISIYQPALTGVNETLQTIRDASKEHPEQEHFVSLVAFDTGHYNKIYDAVAASDAQDITQDKYRPNGGTPLYDAMGRSLNELKSKIGKDDVVLVTIITDGYENASREYNGPAIKALVESLRKEGWVFTYIGANQDVEKVAESMAINNSMAFQASEEGTRMMFGKEMCSRKNFYRKINPDGKNDKLGEGFFGK